MFGKVFDAFAAKDVVFVVRQLGGHEPGHVFDEPKYGDGDGWGVEHVDALDGVGEGDGLWRADDDGTGERNGLHEGKMNVAGARGEVDEKEVEFVPVGFFNHLLEGVGGHGAAPYGGRIRVDEKADGEEFDTEAGDRLDELAAVDFDHAGTGVGCTEHLGNGGTEYVRINEADTIALEGEGDGQVGGHGGFPDAAFPGGNGDDVFNFVEGGWALHVASEDGFYVDVGDMKLLLEEGFASGDERGGEGVLVALEHEAKTDGLVVSLDVLNHVERNDILGGAGVVDTGEKVTHLFGKFLHSVMF